MDVAAPHDLRHSKRTRRGSGTNDNGKQAPLLPPRHPQEAPAIRAALGVIQAGWWSQEVANNASASDHTFCLKCEPAVLGSTVGMPSLS